MVPIHSAALENLRREHEHDGKTKPHSFTKDSPVTRSLTPRLPVFLAGVSYPAPARCSYRKPEEQL